MLLALELLADDLLVPRPGPDGEPLAIRDSGSRIRDPRVPSECRRRCLLLQALLVRLPDVLVLPLDDRLRPQLLRGTSRTPPCRLSVKTRSLICSRACSNGIVCGGVDRFELQDLIAARACGAARVTSPTFIASISLRSSGDRSSRLSGPIRPAFAFDGASDSSAASFSKLSPAERALADLVGLGLAPLRRRRRSASRRRPAPPTKISRSVIVCGVVNSFEVRVVVAAAPPPRSRAILPEHLVLLHALTRSSAARGSAADRPASCLPA